MSRSLLDRADLALLRQVSAGRPTVALAAGLVDTGLLQFDPDDPGWPDRDRVVVCGQEAAAALRERVAAAGGDAAVVATEAALGGDALALALGAALASRLDGSVWRSWCLLGEDAVDDGRLWEVATAAREARADMLTVLGAGTAAAALWHACGWTVHTAPAGDPAWLLGALDHAVAAGPAVVLATADG